MNDQLHWRTMPYPSLLGGLLHGLVRRTARRIGRDRKQFKDTVGLVIAPRR